MEQFATDHNLELSEVAIEEADEAESTICGNVIKHDNSGVGHNWRRIDASEIPADIREEIAAEIIDGKKSTCECYTASNGLNYQW